MRLRTAEMAEFSAGLQTRQEERYVLLLFLLFLRGTFYEFFMTIALAIPPLTVKIRGGGALIRDCALNRANTVSHMHIMRAWFSAEAMIP